MLLYMYTHALQAPRPTEHDTGRGIPLPDASEHDAPDQVSSQYTWNTRATVHADSPHTSNVHVHLCALHVQGHMQVGVTVSDDTASPSTGVLCSR